MNEIVLQSWFDECWSRVTRRAAAWELWNLALEEDERELLGGDFQSALNTHKSAVRMWMVAKTVSNVHIAAVELGRELNLCDQNRAKKLLEALGGHASISFSERPRWNARRGLLMFRGKCVRQVRIFKQPSNVQIILNVFEAAKWTEFIDVPQDFDPEKVRETLRSLRNGLKEITFEQKNGGTKVCWRKV